MAVDVLQRVHHDLGVARVERGDGLVGQHDVGLLDQGAGDGDALLLAAGQGLGALAGHPRHVEAFERRQGLGLLVVAPHLQERAGRRHVEGAAHHDVGQHVEAAGEIELLEDHGAAGAPGAQRPAAQRRDVGVAEQDAARGRIAEAIDHAQEGRLAGAGPADHADHLARRHDQRNAVHGVLAAEALGHAFQSQHPASGPHRTLGSRPQASSVRQLGYRPKTVVEKNAHIG